MKRKMCLGAAILIALLFAACPFGSVHPQPPSPSGNGPGVAPEACLFNKPEDISNAIAAHMGNIAAKLKEAEECASQNRTSQSGTTSSSCPDPGYCGQSGSGLPLIGDNSSSVQQKNYSAWLSYISYAIRDYSGPTIDQQLGRDTEATKYQGLGAKYQAVAQSAQGIDQMLASCRNPIGPGMIHGNGNPPQPDNPFVNPHPRNTGTKDTGLQRAEIESSSFFEVGESIFDDFKGCSASVRHQASAYLMDHYSWEQVPPGRTR